MSSLPRPSLFGITVLQLALEAPLLADATRRLKAPEIIGEVKLPKGIAICDKAS
jgi:hypothetical protein